MFVRIISNQIAKCNRTSIFGLKTLQIQIKTISYKRSPPVGDPSNYTDWEIINNPKEWKYVERLLPLKWIPQPKPKEIYPSGFIPQTADPEKLPYFVERTKNFMLPVYLKIDKRGTQRLTKLRRVEGDIWKLSRELVEYIKANGQLDKLVIGTQVDELKRMIILRGDYVEYTKKFLIEKGF